LVNCAPNYISIPSIVCCYSIGIIKYKKITADIYDIHVIKLSRFIYKTVYTIINMFY